MSPEALAALYYYAPKCRVCAEYLATRKAPLCVLTCDRLDCGDANECLACGRLSTVSFRKVNAAPVCSWCHCGEVRRVPLSVEWEDLPHASSLRAANAAHEALS